MFSWKKENYCPNKTVPFGGGEGGTVGPEVPAHTGWLRTRILQAIIALWLTVS